MGMTGPPVWMLHRGWEGLHSVSVRTTCSQGQPLLPWYVLCAGYLPLQCLGILGRASCVGGLLMVSSVWGSELCWKGRQHSTAAFLLQVCSMRSWRGGTKKADVIGGGVIGEKETAMKISHSVWCVGETIQMFLRALDTGSSLSHSRRVQWLAWVGKPASKKCLCSARVLLLLYLPWSVSVLSVQAKSRSSCAVCTVPLPGHT